MFESLQNLAEETWKLSQAQSLPKNEQYKIKKEYVFHTRYPSDNPIVYSLEEPSKPHGFNFIGYYPPTGAYFGFRTWQEAYCWAKMRKEHLRALDNLFR